MNQGPSAKRVPPAEVPPVVVGNMRVEVVHFGRNEGFNQNGGILRAVDAANGSELWTLKVYDVTYDDHMESDVQDVFITSMRKAMIGNKLLITDENARKWTVDPATRAVSAG